MGKIGRLGASWARILARLGEISIFPRVYPSPGELTPLREPGKGAGHFHLKPWILIIPRTFGRVPERGKLFGEVQGIDLRSRRDFPSEIPLLIIQHACGRDKHGRRIIGLIFPGSGNRMT